MCGSIYTLVPHLTHHLGGAALCLSEQHASSSAECYQAPSSCQGFCKSSQDPVHMQRSLLASPARTTAPYPDQHWLGHLGY